MEAAFRSDFSSEVRRSAKGFDHEDLLPLWRHLGEPVKIVGQGSFATAFEDPANRRKVVKVTSDGNDAMASTVVQGLQSKGKGYGFVRIDSVAQVTKRENGAVLWVIRAERLYPAIWLSSVPVPAIAKFVKILREAVNANLNDLHFYLLDKMNRGETVTAKDRGDVVKALKDFLFVIDQEQWSARDKGEKWVAGTLMQIGVAVQEMIDNEILTPDLALRNWGFRWDKTGSDYIGRPPNSDIALLDFGLSSGGKRAGGKMEKVTITGGSR